MNHDSAPNAMRCWVVVRCLIVGTAAIRNVDNINAEVESDAAPVIVSMLASAVA
jgi:hypothetical protein